MSHKRGGHRVATRCSAGCSYVFVCLPGVSGELEWFSPASPASIKVYVHLPPLFVKDLSASIDPGRVAPNLKKEKKRRKKRCIFGFQFLDVGLQFNASSAPSEPKVTSAALQGCTSGTAWLRECLCVPYSILQTDRRMFHGASVCCV